MCTVVNVHKSCFDQMDANAIGRETCTNRSLPLNSSCQPGISPTLGGREGMFRGRKEGRSGPEEGRYHILTPVPRLKALHGMCRSVI